MAFVSRGVIGGALLMAGLALGSASAGSLSVAPTTLRLSANGGTTVLYTTNHGGYPITVQIEGYLWQQSDNTDHLVATDALQLSPPMARIAPGQRQTIRLRVAPSGSSRERAFRLMVSELPDPGLEPSRGVHVLLQFSVPLFVDVHRNDLPILVWRARRDNNGIHLSVRNEGSGYAKLVGLVATAPNGKHVPIVSNTLNYVLAGAGRNWTIPASTARVGRNLVIEGMEMHRDAAVRATVRVQR